MPNIFTFIQAGHNSIYFLPLISAIVCIISIYFVSHKQQRGAIQLLPVLIFAVVSAVIVTVIFFNRQQNTGEIRSLAAVNQTCFDECRKNKGTKVCTEQCGGAKAPSSAKPSTKPTPVLDSCYTACRKDKGKKVCDEKCGTSNGQQQTGQGGATTKGSCAFYDCTRKLVYDNERGNGHLEPGCCGPTCGPRCGVSPAPTKAAAPTAAPTKDITVTGKTSSGACQQAKIIFPARAGASLISNF